MNFYKYLLTELSYYIVEGELHNVEHLRVCMVFLSRVGIAHRMRGQHLRSTLCKWIMNLEERQYKCELLRAMSHVTSCESSKVIQ